MSNGKEPESLVENIVAFERGYASCDVSAKFKPHADFEADILIVAIGENVPAIETAETQDSFRNAFRLMIKTLTQRRKPALFIRSCFWENTAKDKVMREVCGEFGGTFVDISKLSKDSANFARSERTFQDDGVAGHPGDKGMAAIASAIWLAIEGEILKTTLNSDKKKL